MAGFGKVARKPRLTLGSAIGDAGVVTVSELVGASHCRGLEDEVKVMAIEGYWVDEQGQCKWSRWRAAVGMDGNLLIECVCSGWGEWDVNQSWAMGG